MLIIKHIVKKVYIQNRKDRRELNNNPKIVTNSIKKGPIMFIMILGAFIATLNQTLMSVATPELMVEFKITAATAQWLTTGYMLVNGVLIPITAYLMQRFTTRQLFQASMFIFLAGTIVSAIATGFTLLLTGRMIQAAGAGIIMPAAYECHSDHLPSQQKRSSHGDGRACDYFRSSDWAYTLPAILLKTTNGKRCFTG